MRLKFVPIVLGNGKIRLKLNPEVSDLDFSSPLTIVGSKIPITRPILPLLCGQGPL